MNKNKIISSLNPLFFNGIAHRGLHNDEYSENSIKAFKNALDHKVAIELDVHLTKDNELIVCHDSELNRVTGKDGIIEDLTLSEIKTNYLLKDESRLPTLKEVLDLTKEEIPIVIELKVYRKNYKELGKRVKIDLESIKNKSNFMLISFDPRALFQFKKYGIVRSLLLIDIKKYHAIYFFRHFFESIDFDQRLLKYRKYRNYHKKHLTNIWTIESEEDLRKVASFTDLVTFQHIDYNLVKKVMREEAISDEK